MAVTSKQIAELAGVSRGTVDRALHNRGRVSPEVAERIRKLAKELEYQPNAIGRALVKTSQDFKIGVVLQSIETPTMQIVSQGVQQAADELKTSGVELCVHKIHRLDTAAVLECIDRFLTEGVRGFAIAPNNAPEIRERINELHEDGIPVITLNSDAPGSARLCFIGMDNYRAGQTAAGLMRMLLPAGGKVFPLTGHLNNAAHNNRLTGFTDTLAAEHAQDIQLLPFQPCFDRDDFAYEITQHVLVANPDLAGVYVSANGQLGVCDAIRDAGLTGEVRVIAFDLTPPNDDLLREGKISILLDQDAFEQGYRPPLLLHEYLLHQRTPERELMYTDIRICTKYNTGEPIAVKPQ